ncbi:hypothetical protein LINPERHAP1_LOCUS39595, partial [Linum perenne]
MKLFKVGEDTVHSTNWLSSSHSVFAYVFRVAFGTGGEMSC